MAEIRVEERRGQGARLALLIVLLLVVVAAVWFFMSMTTTSTDAPERGTAVPFDSVHFVPTESQMPPRQLSA